jgi:hypothetical protein
LNGLDQDQGRQSTLRVDGSQMLSADFVPHRQHVLDNTVRRLRHHEENFVYHFRTETRSRWSGRRVPLPPGQ